MREKAMREVILAQLGALRADAGVELWSRARMSPSATT